jgi:hypothetical protein
MTLPPSPGRAIPVSPMARKHPGRTCTRAATPAPLPGRCEVFNSGRHVVTHRRQYRRKAFPMVGFRAQGKRWHEEGLSPNTLGDPRPDRAGWR